MALNQGAMYALGILLPILGTISMFARLYVRWNQKPRFGVDDCAAAGGFLGMWSVAGVILAGTAKGFFGGHTIQDPATGESSLTTADRKDVEFMWIVIILTVFSIGLVKLSVIFLYRRIFTISRVFNIYSIVLAVAVSLAMLAFIFANIFDCGSRPWAAWTNAYDVITYCDNIDGLNAGFALQDLIMDLFILLAPMPILWGLKMSLSRKLQVMGIFALGFLSTAASAARAASVLIDAYGTTLSYRDIQGENSKIVTWSLLEVTAALIASCLPTLRPLMAKGGSLGSLIDSFFSVISLHSRNSKHSHQQPELHEKELALATIGGTGFRKMMDDEVREDESKASSAYDLKDVGQLV